MKIGIIINASKDIDGAIIKFVKEKLSIFYSDVEIQIFDDPNIHKKKISKLDFILVLGGDGTVLRSAKAVIEKEIPILPINIGSLGFITSGELEELEKILKKIVAKQYYIEERLVLNCNIQGDHEFNFIALNEVTITKGTLSRIVKYNIEINDKMYSSFKGDGVIISTPTGSTAYSLSAGGPIIEPSLELISITPICSQNFSIRTMVLDKDSKVKVYLSEVKDKVYITIDGQEYVKVDEKDIITLTSYHKKIKFIRTDNYDYFNILNKKILSNGKEY
ncbi:NAD(+)/NADH kinase [uncultured Clostridium sp.]|uniref:NAD(+)/NADH kinase n=1 Tax=uncultured Clostridium sp. TaxID=59620 RepID=UPI0025F4308F|nr:NAD(+)/NADH kinase [uncultured Clostridium sp.]